MSITDQIDPPWQTANILESHANISFLLSGVGFREPTSAAVCMRA